MIYVGVKTGGPGAFAICRGMKGETEARAFDPAEFTKALQNIDPMDARCVIEMPDEGLIERAVKPINAAVFARMYCRSRGIPFMFVKIGNLKREYMAKGTLAEECKIRYPEIELRGSTEEQEVTAAAVLLAKYAKRFL